MSQTYTLSQEELEEVCRRALQEKYPTCEVLKEEEYEIILHHDAYCYRFSASVVIEG